MSSLYQPLWKPRGQDCLQHLEFGPQVHATFSLFTRLLSLFFCFTSFHAILQFVSRIEKKRTVIPALLEALQNHRSTDINLNYFYQLLFTRENLKLVHIVCHKKGAHNLQCDTKKIYTNATKDLKAKQKPKVKKRRMT